MKPQYRLSDLVQKGSRRAAIAGLALAIILFTLAFTSVYSSLVQSSGSAFVSQVMAISKVRMLRDENFELAQDISRLIEAQKDTFKVQVSIKENEHTIFASTIDSHDLVTRIFGKTIVADEALPNQKLLSTTVTIDARPAFKRLTLPLMLACLILVSPIIIFLKYFRGFSDKLRSDLFNIDQIIISNNHRDIRNLYNFVETAEISRRYFHMSHERELLYRDKELLRIAEAKASLAQQVAHDIRSPIAALKEVEKHTVSLPAQVRSIFELATRRIDDIAKTLTEQNDVLEKNSGFFVASAIEAIIKEKAAQLKEEQTSWIQFTPHDSQRFLRASGKDTEFLRIISNLVNNALEAIPEGKAGSVKIQIEPDNNQIKVVIRDNGRGIPLDKIKLIGTRGISFGEKTGDSGSGLGVWHARTVLEKQGGSLSIESGTWGTEVTCKTPKDPFTDWLCDKISVGVNRLLCVVDDDDCIHSLWERKTAQIPEIELNHFKTTKEFETWFNSGQKGIYLVDYDLGPNCENGINLIKRLKIANDSFLVTSLSNDTKLIEQCLSLGIRILPKDLIPFIEITSI